RWCMRTSLRWIAACLLAACVSPPIETPSVHTNGEGWREVVENVRDKADILFLIDNSGSMKPMQEELKQRFGQFFQPFADRAAQGQYADLHIGVVTSDFGAGTGNNSCGPSPGGQRGRLQARGAKADPSCKAPMGASFIAYRFGPGASNNLPTGQDLVGTFTCMASVGAGG